MSLIVSWEGRAEFDAVFSVTCEICVKSFEAERRRDECSFSLEADLRLVCLASVVS